MSLVYFQVCTIFGMLNCGGPKAKLVLGQLSFLEFLLQHILKSCSVAVAHTYQSFLALRTWSNRLRELPPDQVPDADTDLVMSCVRM